MKSSRHLLRITAALLISMEAAQVFAGNSVSIDFILEPTRTLPGIPVSVRLKVDNLSSRAITLPRKILLRVVPSTGEPFIAEWGFGQESRFLHADLLNGSNDVRIPAGDERAFTFRATDIERAPGWFVDPRLNAPGTYRLQALLVDLAREEELFHTPALQVESKIPVRFISPEAVLIVDTPTGIDNIVWNKMLSASSANGRPWSIAYLGISSLARLAAEIIGRYPESTYAPYVVPYYAGVPDQERIAATRQILLLHPNAPNRDSLRLLIAQQEAAVSGDAMATVRPNRALAIEMNQKAWSDFMALERESLDPDIRKASEAERAKLPTIKDLEERLPPSAQQ